MLLAAVSLLHFIIKSSLLRVDEMLLLDTGRKCLKCGGLQLPPSRFKAAEAELL